MKKPFLLWLGLLILSGVVFAFVFTPIWIIRPFEAQSESGLALSFFLKNWSPLVSIIALAISFILAFFIWKASKKWYGKVFLILPLALIGLFTWLARQNHFEWMFNPLQNSAYVKASDAKFVEEGDMLMALEINGESAAYPIRQMAYHHIASDIVGGIPITATY